MQVNDVECDANGCENAACVCAIALRGRRGDKSQVYRMYAEQIGECELCANAGCISTILLSLLVFGVHAMHKYDE